jgi:hypothetical protein
MIYHLNGVSYPAKTVKSQHLYLKSEWGETVQPNASTERKQVVLDVPLASIIQHFSRSK